MDLPAPVSPVKTVSPFSKEMERASMIAKFLIDNSDNKVYSPY
jgi:hypothetical protein